MGFGDDVEEGHGHDNDLSVSVYTDEILSSLTINVNDYTNIQEDHRQTFHIFHINKRHLSYTHTLTTSPHPHPTRMTIFTTTATTTTQAYICRPPAAPSLETLTYQTPGSYEVLVDIVGASICHSDIRAAAGQFYIPPPFILGHEGSGYVRAVGRHVTSVKPGDAVALTVASCMECRRCKSGKNPYCDQIRPLNFGGKTADGNVAATTTDGDEGIHGFFFGQSSMARVALVREVSCVKLGDVSKEELKICAPLGCGVQTGAGAIM